MKNKNTLEAIKKKLISFNANRIIEKKEELYVEVFFFLMINPIN